MATGSTGGLFIPVRHCSPPGKRNNSAMLRTGTPASVAWGLLPPMAKRPITGNWPGAKTLARDRSAACPLLSKWPLMQMPFAWFLR
ncbi:hypothetical protein D9M68_970860 [compost metagenome]